MKKTNSQRVDIILKEGVDHPENWSRIKRYVDIYSRKEPLSDWHHEFMMLHQHHTEEMSFLLELIVEMRERLLKQKDI